MSIFASQKALASLAFRLGEMDSEVRSLKTANKHLELEFTDLFDKVRHQMSRMAKRYAVDQKDNGEAVVENAIATGEPELDPISAAIHARRGKGFLVP